MAPAVPRRDFLRSAATLSAGTLLAGRLGWADPAPESATGRVVHVRHGRAATWSRSSGLYRDFVSQPRSIRCSIPEPVIAVIRGFVRAGGRSANVRVYDLTSSGGGRAIPTWLRNRVLAACPDVQFADRAANKGAPSARRPT